MCVLVLSGCGPSADASQQPGQLISYSEPDLVNPLRGQYENLATELFPQSNPEQPHPAWPGTADVGVRLEWRTLQPRDPRTLPRNAPDDVRFDFTVLDRALEAAQRSGKRVGLRVTSFNSCCEAQYPRNVDVSVPEWLRTVDGATQTFRHEDVSYVIPDWNNKAYLSYFGELLAALGRRYDDDERLAWFEMSGYGDFSENHVAFMRDTLGKPAPAPEDSEKTLGYYSQYRDQYITKAAVTQLVEANLRAFPHTTLVTAPGNPEITRQLFRDSPALRGRREPVGIRADGLGAFSPIPTWAEHPDSWYVKNRDPIVNVVVNRYRTAPIITEWIPNPPEPEDPMTYYRRGLRDVVNRHVSMTSSTGFPGQLQDRPMPDDQYRVWAKANKFSGYRYAATATQPSFDVAASDRTRVTVRWRNLGSAPAYERWQPVYDIIGSDGRTVRTLPARIDLRSLVADQRFEDDSDEPAVASTDDVLTVAPGLPAGTYQIRTRVLWHEHKPNATVTVDFPPMQLSQTGRDAAGSYPVATLTVR
ncbi:hypothetical protein AFA91_00550 [Mycolicibacterium goodii]|uniref:Uncharacterized protein n=1 Tax=Mycolicibacterium goodii TaxID=134601 RepID=A0A0K0XF03_MYCGD|nr:hypothetical protein AFA91_00550 [Mycolicibacterium goodii]